MYWSRATGPREVHGDILTKFDSIGGRASWGFPTTDVFNISGIPGAQESDFQGVRIYTSAAGPQGGPRRHPRQVPRGGRPTELGVAHQR